MERILTVVGARPQFIKAAAITHTIKDKYADQIVEDILHTGQHYDNAMSGQFFTELDIPQPKYNLGVGSGSHGTQTADMLKGIENTLISGNYNGVILYGDTNSTLAGALAASKLHIPVYHIEAGLRSFNRNMPEEINRILTDHVSTLLFAPTQTAIRNLKHEGFKEEEIVFSGDVMLDNVLRYSPISTPRFPLPDSFILATIHRDFNTDIPKRLKSILSALNTISEQYQCDILFPLHPRTKQRLDSMNLTNLPNHIKITDPFSYLETLAALQKARLVLTDSGGLQKEACFCHRPCVVLRPETEWTELVDTGAALLADADEKRIIDATALLIDKTTNPPACFGNGHAAQTILESILNNKHKS